MNLLINMSNLRFGGGISVAKNLMGAVIPLRTQDHFTLICPKDCGYETLSAGNVEIIYVPASFHFLPWVKHWHHHYKFPALVRKKKIDKIISLGNVAFPAESIPQLLLIQNAWLVYPRSLAWKRTDIMNWVKNKLMIRYIANYLKYASSYALQTTIMEQRFARQFKPGTKKTYIIPNSFTATTVNESPLPDCNVRPIKLLMLSKYYGYKHFQILIRLAMILKERGERFQIDITIDKEESAAAGRFLKKVKRLKVDDVIYSIGHVPMHKVGETIQQYHGMFLPTLLESFSGTYVEAMVYGRPLFTSELDFAKAICGDAAFYFDPSNAANIADTLVEAFKNKKALNEKVQKGKVRVATMPNWLEIGSQFSQIIDRFE